MEHREKLTVEKCRSTTYDFLDRSNLNVFLVDDYKEIDQEDSGDFEQYELCRSIVFEALIKNNLFYLDANQSDRWFRYFEDEIYKLLTKSTKYKKDTVYFDMVLGGSVTQISDYILERFSVDHMIAVGLASLLVYTIIKVGINAWCEKYRNDRGINDNE